jgi:hypothetical protein
MAPQRGLDDRGVLLPLQSLQAPTQASKRAALQSKLRIEAGLGRKHLGLLETRSPPEIFFAVPPLLCAVLAAVATMAPPEAKAASKLEGQWQC